MLAVKENSAEAFFHQGDQLLLPLVRRLDVVDQLGELDVTVRCQEKGFPRLCQELDELCIVARGDGCESRVGRGDKGREGRL